MFVFVLNLHSLFSNLLQILEKTIKNMIFCVEGIEISYIIL